MPKRLQQSSKCLPRKLKPTVLPEGVKDVQLKGVDTLKPDRFEAKIYRAWLRPGALMKGSKIKRPRVLSIAA